MLNDDFMKAIRVLWQNHLYISCMKLLVIFYDTLAFTESGDSFGGKGFKQWMNSYMSLDVVGITADELWELRNSLLHNTTLDSKKIQSGEVERLIAYIGELPEGSPSRDKHSKWFSLHQLIMETGPAVSRYIQSMNENPHRWEDFFNRYDRVVSDTRMPFFEIEVDQT